MPQEKGKTAPHEFYDTEVLPFPERNRKATKDEQFKKFIEVIQKLYTYTVNWCYVGPHICQVFKRYTQQKEATAKRRDGEINWGVQHSYTQLAS